MHFEFEGNPEVLHNIVLRKQLLERGDKKASTFSPVLYAGSGLQRGVFGAGLSRALEKRELFPAFAHLVGSSTGAATLQFGPSGQIARCISIYWEAAASKEFVNFRRYGSSRPVEDVDFLCDVFRQQLDLAAFRASPLGMWVCATSGISGQGVLLDAKDGRRHPVLYVKASISIPGLCSGPVVIDGHPYFDGAGMGMPTQKIIEQLQPTDLLVFANCSSKGKDDILSRAMTAAIMARQPSMLRKAFVSRNVLHAEGVEYLRRQQQVRWAIVWSEGVGSYERNPKILETAVDEADLFLTKLLHQHAPPR